MLATGVGDADSLRVEVREEERLVWSGLVPVPTVGRVVRVPLELAAPVRTRGFIQVGDRFVPVESGPERVGSVGADSVAARARDAYIVVLHGLGAGAPDWARQVAAQAPRTLVFVNDPAGGGGGRRAGGFLPAGRVVPGEELPPSPLLAELAALRFQGLPPLTDVFSSCGRLGRRRTAGGASARDGARRKPACTEGAWRWAGRCGTRYGLVALGPPPGSRQGGVRTGLVQRGWMAHGRGSLAVTTSPADQSRG